MCVSHCLLPTDDIVEDEIPLKTFITDPGGLRQFLISNWSLSPDLVDVLLNSSKSVSSAVQYYIATSYPISYQVIIIDFKLWYHMY